MNGRETAGRCRVLRLLSAANSNIHEKARSAPPSGVKPGPFDVVAQRAGRGHALITGLLVIYPVFASVAVVIAGFWFLDGSGPA
jgi:hypothetical protein